MEKYGIKGKDIGKVKSHLFKSITERMIPNELEVLENILTDEYSKYIPMNIPANMNTHKNITCVFGK